MKYLNEVSLCERRVKISTFDQEIFSAKHYICRKIGICPYLIDPSRWIPKSEEALRTEEALAIWPICDARVQQPDRSRGTRGPSPRPGAA